MFANPRQNSKQQNIIPHKHFQLYGTWSYNMFLKQESFTWPDNTYGQATCVCGQEKVATQCREALATRSQMPYTDFVSVTWSLNSEQNLLHDCFAFWPAEDRAWDKSRRFWHSVLGTAGRETRGSEEDTPIADGGAWIGFGRVSSRVRAIAGGKAR